MRPPAGWATRVVVVILALVCSAVLLGLGIVALFDPSGVTFFAYLSLVAWTARAWWRRRVARLEREFRPDAPPPGGVMDAIRWWRDPPEPIQPLGERRRRGAG